MSDFAVGIDLGTSTSEICVFRSNGNIEHVLDGTSQSKSAVIPSVVAVGRDGAICFGEKAKKNAETRSESAVARVKRLLGTDEMVKIADRQFSPEEVSAAILTFLAERAQDHLGTGVVVKDVVITVPANFNDLQRGATRRAGELAGLNVLALINEPTAAARAFAHQNVDVEGRLLVFDFGGGTLDVTIIDMYEGVAEVVSTYGDTELGGKEFDDALAQFIVERFKERHPGGVIGARGHSQLPQIAERAKIELSLEEYVIVDMPFFGQSEGKPIDLDLEITREDFESVVKPLLTRAKDCLDTALGAKAIEPDSVSQVILVGGSTYMPCVRKLVGQVFGRIPNTVVSPDLAVSTGAAVHAADLAGIIKEEIGTPIFVDVTSHGLGTDVAYVGDPELYYDPLIMPNTAIPHAVEREYQLMDCSVDRLRLQLFESHDGLATLCADARKISEGLIEGIPPSHSGTPHAVQVMFRYNSDGEVELEARIPSIGRSCRIAYRASQAVSNGDSNSVRFLSDGSRRAAKSGS